MYLRNLEVVAQMDWRVQRTVVDPRRTREAMLLRQQSVETSARSSQPRWLARWFRVRQGSTVAEPGCADALSHNAATLLPRSPL